MKKKVLSLLLAVVMTFSLAVTANAAEETAQRYGRRHRHPAHQ